MRSVWFWRGAGGVCVCVPARSFPIGSVEVLLRKRAKRGGGAGLAQFHELMKNDLAESSVLCPRLGLDGWGLEGGMRRNIDGREEDLFYPHPPTPPTPSFILSLSLSLCISCLFLNVLSLVIMHLHCPLSTQCFPIVSAPSHSLFYSHYSL